MKENVVLATEVIIGALEELGCSLYPKHFEGNVYTCLNDGKNEYALVKLKGEYKLVKLPKDKE